MFFRKASSCRLHVSSGCWRRDLCSGRGRLTSVCNYLWFIDSATWRLPCALPAFVLELHLLSGDSPSPTWLCNFPNCSGNFKKIFKERGVCSCFLVDPPGPPLQERHDVVCRVRVALMYFCSRNRILEASVLSVHCHRSCAISRHYWYLY